MHQHNLALSLNHGYELAFISLGRIGMVEEMVGEVDRRSNKDGCQAQVVLRCRDKGATNPSFEKLCGDLSFSLFTKGTASSPL